MFSWDVLRQTMHLTGGSSYRNASVVGTEMQSSALKELQRELLKQDHNNDGASLQRWYVCLQKQDLSSQDPKVREIVSRQIHALERKFDGEGFELLEREANEIAQRKSELFIRTCLDIESFRKLNKKISRYGVEIEQLQKIQNSPMGQRTPEVRDSLAQRIFSLEGEKAKSSRLIEGLKNNLIKQGWEEQDFATYLLDPLSHEEIVEIQNSYTNSAVLAEKQSAIRRFMEENGSSSLSKCLKTLSEGIEDRISYIEMQHKDLRGDQALESSCEEEFLAELYQIEYKLNLLVRLKIEEASTAPEKDGKVLSSSCSIIQEEIEDFLGSPIDDVIQSQIEEVCLMREVRILTKEIRIIENKIEQVQKMLQFPVHIVKPLLAEKAQKQRILALKIEGLSKEKVSNAQDESSFKREMEEEIARFSEELRTLQERQARVVKGLAKSSSPINFSTEDQEIYEQIQQSIIAQEECRSFFARTYRTRVPAVMKSLMIRKEYTMLRASENEESLTQSQEQLMYFTELLGKTTVQCIRKKEQQEYVNLRSRLATAFQRDKASFSSFLTGLLTQEFPQEPSICEAIQDVHKDCLLEELKQIRTLKVLLLGENLSDVSVYRFLKEREVRLINRYEIIAPGDKKHKLDPANGFLGHIDEKRLNFLQFYIIRKKMHIANETLPYEVGRLSSIRDGVFRKLQSLGKVQSDLSQAEILVLDVIQESYQAAMRAKQKKDFEDPISFYG